MGGDSRVEWERRRVFGEVIDRSIDGWKDRDLFAFQGEGILRSGNRGRDKRG